MIVGQGFVALKLPPQEAAAPPPQEAAAPPPQEAAPLPQEAAPLPQDDSLLPLDDDSLPPLDAAPPSLQKAAPTTYEDATPSQFTPPYLPYDPLAEVYEVSDGTDSTIRVITHECLEGDALRCVIKPVKIHVPLQLDDYVRAGDILKFLQAMAPRPLPPPSSSAPISAPSSNVVSSTRYAIYTTSSYPQCPVLTRTNFSPMIKPTAASSFIVVSATAQPVPPVKTTIGVPGKPSAAVSSAPAGEVFVITATPEDGGTTITTTITLTPDTPVSDAPASSTDLDLSSSSVPTGTTVTSKLTLGSTVIPIETTIPVGTSSIVVPIGSTTVPIVSYLTVTIPAAATSPAPNALTTKALTLGSTVIPIETTISLGPLSSIAVPIGSITLPIVSYITATLQAAKATSHSKSAPKMPTPAIPIQAISTVRRPPGGWPFESQPTKSVSKLSSGSKPTTSSSSAPAGRPFGIDLGGPTGILALDGTFPDPTPPSPAAATPLSVEEAIMQLVDKLNHPWNQNGHARVPDHVPDGGQHKRDVNAPGRPAEHGVKLTSNVAKISLSEYQTINPNAKLLRKLRANHLLLLPKELDAAAEVNTAEPFVPVEGLDVEKRSVGDTRLFAEQHPWFSYVRAIEADMVEREADWKKYNDGMTLAVFVVCTMVLTAAVVGGVAWFLRRNRERSGLRY
ncbi:hypothetical protein BU23DRAFT_573019 [Bimuria novae-zelandiae CBS 107.79]|uniref:Uncharacterized protein n=1 Tax=Bimuria novae-zelandiae CBS 107.79 TaxID=1447943 RepID=A0A6A5URY0_9PLEO|nr:hypothetical protein BU23DRAFT_573019 [Bimuria novae-zelandiae CBS 107.79]